MWLIKNATKVTIVGRSIFAETTETERIDLKREGILRVLIATVPKEGGTLNYIGTIKISHPMPEIHLFASRVDVQVKDDTVTVVLYQDPLKYKDSQIQTRESGG